MVTLPKGRFSMGTSDSVIAALVGKYGNGGERYFKWESPQHRVAIGKSLAVGKFDVTFDDWAACVSGGGCTGNRSPGDNGWGKGKRPVINVSWDDAQDYVKWLSRKSGQKYRLLTEAEWEYAAQASTQTHYYWGNDLGKNQANCAGCDSEWDNKQTAPVGSFPANAFGLHDMAGNVWQWTEDCWNENYGNGPSDGSAWTSGDCGRRVVRGGSWNSAPWYLRAAARGRNNSGSQDEAVGFRVARTLTP